ncbi:MULTISPECIES: biopolymer transporter ExbD [Deefgea]|uniref:Biopolymer transporter ExbD n=1 Tax=Deefgea piscis TaxID=2739061 RepID=A0A6M8SPZ2_9NEIS|nr:MULTISPECIES: biopolymer transporter ExbD [Deefgea]MBM5574244.1 protein TolR [Deefgea sp. CFH1-16]QKJ66214.1 biopolymer transporter ExbD [Deefgea piscis]
MARRPRRAKNEINVVPYVDVMLVLLVIFMVAAPGMPSGLVELPSAGKSSQQVTGNPMTVDIDKDGAITLKDGQEVTSYPDAKALAAAIKIKVDAAAGTERPVVIAADKNVRYDAVMQTTDALRMAEIPRVALQVSQQ